jgi:hypothetical protein
VSSAEAPATTRGQLWAAAALTAFGIAGIVEARTLPFGGVTRPGPGLFPMCLAIALTLVAAGILASSLRGRTDGAAAGGTSRGGLARAAATLAALFVYTAALEPLGFGLSTFLLIAFLFRAIEPQRWSIALGGAVLTVVASHILFRVWLGVRLPLGPWGF